MSLDEKIMDNLAEQMLYLEQNHGISLENNRELAHKYIRALHRIQKNILPENYGFGEKLAGQLIPAENRILIDGERGNAVNKGYDCLDAAVTARKILKEEGINSSVYEGEAELGLFKTHYYLITDDGVTVDPTPLFPLVGAKHPKGDLLSENAIKKIIKDRKLNACCFSPLSYRKQGSTEYYSSLGIIEKTDDNKPQTILYRIIQLNDRKPVVSYGMNFKMNTLKTKEEGRLLELQMVDGKEMIAGTEIPHSLVEPLKKEAERDALTVSKFVSNVRQYYSTYSGNSFKGATA